MKILKNKKLRFGLAGFITIGGIATLTILLVNNQEDLAPKQASKTEIDGIKLEKNSFKISGLESQATIDLKASVKLPKKVELRYFIGSAAPTSDKNYTTNKPTTLKNGNVVYIKLFIKDKNALTHKLKDEHTNPIIITISGLLIKIDTSKLNPKSFEFESESGMSIMWRSNIDLPEQVKVKGHLVTSSFNPNYKPSDNDYNASLPISYNNENAIIYVKFFIKNQFKSAYQFPNEFQDTITFKNITLPYVGSSDESTIFKDSRNNLWLMAGSKKLHVLAWNDETKQYDDAWTDDVSSGLTNNSKIEDCYYGTIFEDSRGNLWAMGNNSKLQVLAWNDETKQYASSWTSDNTTGLLNNSKIINGKAGTIFEDSKGNLWAMGKDSKLQVLTWNDETKQYAIAWVSVTCNGLTSRSEIVNGFYGTVFEDSHGNLWAMGKKSKLQVLAWNDQTKQYVSFWTSDTSSGLTNGSKIIAGVTGTIFEDSRGNLWAMARNSKLQVLAWNDQTKQYASSWTSDNTTGLLNNSNIINGLGGTIFEDSRGNLWAMARNSKLQVLAWNDQTKQYASSWTSDNTTGLLNNSNIINGVGGTIFEDSRGNLWAMARNSKLQVLAWNDQTNQYTSSWTSNTDSGLLKDSNVTNGFAGTIFEDSYGNIWIGSYRKTLQVFDQTRQKWIQASRK